MRSLFLFFILFCSVQLNAQSSGAAIANDSVVEGLSESELQTAKEDYQRMLKSQRNIDKNEYNRMIKEKLKGVDASIDMRNDKIRDLDDIREVVTRKLTGNIHKTDFTSVEEGVEAVMRSYALIEEIMQENKELYGLIKRATIKQQLEIYKRVRPNIGY